MGWVSTFAVDLHGGGLTFGFRRPRSRLSAAPQHKSHSCEQRGVVKGLLDERHSHQSRFAQDCFVPVARHKHNLDARPQRANGLDQVGSLHTGHHNIREKQVDASRVLLNVPDCFGSTFRHQQGVSSLPQHLTDQFAQRASCSRGPSAGRSWREQSSILPTLAALQLSRDVLQEQPQLVSSNLARQHALKR